jgi:hypothetical protein
MHRRYNMKVIAFVLVLAFSQRLGLNLWMHRLYHEGPRSHTVSKASIPGLPGWEIRCDCFDDAFMPMDEAYVFELHAPRIGYLLLETAYIPGTAYAVVRFPSLRGPPGLFFDSIS